MKKLLFCLALTSYVSSAILQNLSRCGEYLKPRMKALHCTSNQRIETITTSDGCSLNTCVNKNCPDLNLQSIECNKDSQRIETIPTNDGCHKNICVDNTCPSKAKVLTCAPEDQVTTYKNGCPITSCKDQKTK